MGQVGIVLIGLAVAFLALAIYGKYRQFHDRLDDERDQAQADS